MGMTWMPPRGRRFGDKTKVSLIRPQSPDAVVRSNQHGLLDEKFKGTRALPLSGLTLSVLNSAGGKHKVLVGSVSKLAAIAVVAEVRNQQRGRASCYREKKERVTVEGRRGWMGGFVGNLATEMVEEGTEMALTSCCAPKLTKTPA
jgi:hypothetical protein